MAVGAGDRLQTCLLHRCKKPALAIHAIQGFAPTCQMCNPPVTRLDQELRRPPATLEIRGGYHRCCRIALAAIEQNAGNSRLSDARHQLVRHAYAGQDYAIDLIGEQVINYGVNLFRAIARKVDRDRIALTIQRLGKPLQGLAEEPVLEVGKDNSDAERVAGMQRPRNKIGNVPQLPGDSPHTRGLLWIDCGRAVEDTADRRLADTGRLRHIS